MSSALWLTSVSHVEKCGTHECDGNLNAQGNGSIPVEGFNFKTYRYFCFSTFMAFCSLVFVKCSFAFYIF